MTASLTIYPSSDINQPRIRRVVYEFEIEDIQGITEYNDPEYVIGNTIGKQMANHLNSAIDLLDNNPIKIVTIKRDINSIKELVADGNTKEN